MPDDARGGPPETWFCMCFVGRNRKLNAATVERCERCGMTAPNVPSGKERP